MSAFTGRLVIAEVDLGSYRWELIGPLVYEVGALGSGRAIAVPPGFVSDGASVPAPASAFITKWGRSRRAAVVHDWLYARLAAGDPHPEAPTRRAADAVFREALGVSGVHAALAFTMWAAVRIFGGVALARRDG